MRELTEAEREFLVEHERMHAEFRARIGMQDMSAEQIFTMLMQLEGASTDD